jgi:hypothetical protein
VARFFEHHLRTHNLGQDKGKGRWLYDLAPVPHARPREKLLILPHAVVSKLLDDWRQSEEDYPELDEA